MRIVTLVVLSAWLTTACTGQSIKPAEALDERTGMTVGALQTPMEFVESPQSGGAPAGKRTSFAYLGPVEWDRSGDITYGLWVHVAPGDKPIDDLRAPGAVALELDGAPIVLTPMDAPPPGRGPYKPVAAWGQTSYFELDAALLKRMAASGHMSVDIRAQDRSALDFAATDDTRATLRQFVHARGISDD